MPEPTKCSGIHQSLDVHRHFFTQIAFHAIVTFDDFSNLDDFVFTDILHANGSVDSGLFQNRLSGNTANPLHIRQTDIDPFVFWQIHARNTRHNYPLIPSLDCTVSWLEGPSQHRSDVAMTSLLQARHTPAKATHIPVNPVAACDAD